MVKILYMKVQILKNIYKRVAWLNNTEFQNIVGHKPIANKATHMINNLDLTDQRFQ